MAKPYYYDVPRKCIHNWDNGKGDPKVGKGTYLDDIMKKFKRNPQPPTHSKLSDWNKSSQSTAMNGHPHKMKFLKSKRETLPEYLARIEKKRNSPAPGTYQLPKEKI